MYTLPETDTKCIGKQRDQLIEEKRRREKRRIEHPTKGEKQELTEENGMERREGKKELVGWREGGAKKQEMNKGEWVQPEERSPSFSLSIPSPLLDHSDRHRAPSISDGSVSQASIQLNTFHLASDMAHAYPYHTPHLDTYQRRTQDTQSQQSPSISGSPLPTLQPRQEARRALLDSIKMGSVLKKVPEYKSGGKGVRESSNWKADNRGFNIAMIMARREMISMSDGDDDEREDWDDPV